MWIGDTVESAVDLGTLLAPGVWTTIAKSRGEEILEKIKFGQKSNFEFLSACLAASDFKNDVLHKKEKEKTTSLLQKHSFEIQNIE